MAISIIHLKSRELTVDKKIKHSNLTGFLTLIVTNGEKVQR